MSQTESEEVVLHFETLANDPNAEPDDRMSAQDILAEDVEYETVRRRYIEIVGPDYKGPPEGGCLPHPGHALRSPA